MECGTIVSVNRSVETVEFQESGGGFQVVGTRVDQFGSTFGRASMHTAVGYSRASSEQTVNRARTSIEDVAYNLRMPDSVVSSATRLYRLALMANFTRGRRTNNTISAVLYATCRMFTPKPLPYMLIDFADYFRVNVFELGHTFLRLSETLGLRLPLIDPSIYVPRFARELNLGGKQHRVSQCAVRLVARMKRDWIVTGRRPAGISGAGLLIACRLFGFKRTLEEMSLLVHLSTTTLRKRLLEFRDTAACQMTSVEFDSILDFDDIEASDPPCYTKGRKHAEKLRNQPILTVAEIEMRVQEAMGILSESELNSITCSRLAPANEKQKEILASQSNEEGQGEGDGPVDGEEDDDSATQPPAKRFKPNPSAAKTLKEECDEEDEEDLDAIYGEFGDEDEDDFCTQPYGEEMLKPEESLSDIDDDEINAMINDDSEVRINEMIWNSMYSEWEKARQERLAAEEDDEPRQVGKKTPRRKREKADTPAEAVSSVLERRMISTKINQNAIASLIQASAEKVARPNPLLAFIKTPAAETQAE